ncbi:MAG: putative 2OG-Fe(II) oxygenase [Woeseiaceae bacterium]|nr:putative 2OG-Fe(II) oxygenase [Woeseiaceae bacterium]
MLNDYENMVRVYDVPIPAAYRDAAGFNAELARTLETLHIGKRHPPEQTLRGGSQTYGDLFVRKEPEIVELVQSIKHCVEDYIGRMPQHAEHPLLARRASQYDFRASWSVKLASCGYHEMHVHPLGWISSAYYVQVPTEVSQENDDQGGIKFGEPDIDIGEEGRARRLIKPATGRLVLFPSYMWHGTDPVRVTGPTPDGRIRRRAGWPSVAYGRQIG